MPLVPAADAPRGPGPAIISVILAVSSLTVMANATIAPSLPEMRSVFADVPRIDTLAGLIVTLPSLFVVLSATTIGWLADRTDRRRVLAICMIAYALGGASGFVAGSMGAILAGRALLGIGVAGTLTIASAYVGEFWYGPARERFLGLQVGAMNGGGIAFVLIGGMLAAIGWRLPFLLYLTALPLAAAALVVLPHPAPRQTHATSLEGRTEDPFPWGTAASALPLLVAIMALFYIFPTRLPFLLASIGETHPVAAGGTLALVTLTSIPGAVGYGWMRHRLASGTILTTGFALFGLGLLLIAAAQGLATIMLGAILCGAGFGPMTPNVMARLLSVASQAQKGRAAGMLTTAVFAGQFVSPLLSGLILRRGALPDAFSLFGVASFALAVMVASGPPLIRLWRPAAS